MGKDYAAWRPPVINRYNPSYTGSIPKPPPMILETITCCDIERQVFPGDLWTCLTCGTRHQIKRKERTQHG